MLSGMQYQNRGGQMSINNLRVRMSEDAQAVLLSQTSVPLDGYTAAICVDGGTNISLMGRVFHVLEWTDRHVNMVGFASGIEKKNARIGSGVAVYESGHEKVLIGLHESPYLADNALSLLSVGQAREHEVWVEDTQPRHGGRQQLKANDTNSDKWELPLEVNAGLLEMTLRYPTEIEVESNIANCLVNVWNGALGPRHSKRQLRNNDHSAV
jgi:hypothetical protein